MTHDEKDDLRERIHRLVDGDLPAGEEAALRRLLRHHEEGQELLRSLEALQAALPEWKTPAPSESFVGRVVLAVERDQATRNRRSGRRIPVGGLRIPLPVAWAAAALLLISGALTLRSWMASPAEAPSPATPMVPASDGPIDVTDDSGLEFPYSPPGVARPGSPGNPILILDPLDEDKDEDKDEKKDEKKDPNEDGDADGAKIDGSR